MTLATPGTSRLVGFRLLAPYRSLFTKPGTSAFVVAGLIGRFPLSMLALGTVLLVSAITGSYALAGAVAATLHVATAMVGPVMGSLGDRRGQRPVLLFSLSLHAIGATLLVTVAMAHAPHWALFPAAVLTGASTPQIGSFVRARWTALMDGSPKLQTAFSLESVLDEVVFVVGPVLATFLATIVWAPAGVITAAALATSGGLLLAGQRRTQPALVPRTPGRSNSAIRIRGVRVLVVVFIAMGAIFGALDVSMVAFAEDEGAKAAAGALLAAVAFGSLVSGLVYGVVHWRRPLYRRFQLTIALLAVGVVPLALAPNIPLMAVAALLSGLAIAPTLVAGVGLIEATVPASARTEGFTWVSTSLGFGVAVGAAVSGRIVDAYGGHRGFLFSVGAAVAAALITTVGARMLRPSRVERVDPDPRGGDVQLP